MSQPIRILHLSDVHFRVGKGWDAEPVLRELAEFIGREVADGLVPDLVVFTGDLAFSGSKAEYDLARTWLDEQLWPALPDSMPRDRLLLIPGNHDVDRKKVGKGVQNMQTGLLQARSQDDIADLLANDDERGIMLRRHTEYLKFVEGWLGQEQGLPWWQRTLDVRGTSLHLAGLNSAWMSCGNSDRDHLLLGRWQLTRTVGTAEASKADWRIVLVHHPWDYLAEFDCHLARSMVHQHADLLLRGHLHQPQSERVLPPDPSRQCLELAAGCLYEHGTYPNAFQWIELSPEQKRLRVLYRAWLHNAWSIDRNQPGCPEGFADFVLDAPRQRKRGGGKAKPPEVPAAYLDWLWRRNVSVELIGDEQGHAVKLGQVYVPATTQPEVPPDGALQARGRKGSDDEKEEPTLLLGRLDEGSLYVPAPPGAGKTTFCRWAALQCCPASATVAHPVPPPEGYDEPGPQRLRARLPVLVPLREFWTSMRCERGRQSWQRHELEAALAAWIDRSPPPGLTGALLMTHLGAGSAFLLLDGLDEVPPSHDSDLGTVYPRALLLSGLADALPDWEKAGNRLLLTSRPYGLDRAGLQQLGLPEAPLLPLPRELQDLFVGRWFHTLDQKDKAPELNAVLRGRADLAPLAENPLLLTALCVIYADGGRLPEDRYRLYQRLVDKVLFLRYPADAKEREPINARLQAIAFGMHIGEAERPRTTPAAEVGRAEVERLLRRFARLDAAYEPGVVTPAVQCEELLTRSGLLLPRAGDNAAFHHLSFQEFLTAERLAKTTDDGSELERVFREHGQVPEWRPTLLFLFAGQIFNYRTPKWGLELLGRLIADQERAAVEANPAPAVLIAEALQLCLAKGYRVPEALAEHFRRLAVEAIEDEIALADRQALGLALGEFGDPRIPERLGDPGTYVEVPAGRYAYGDEDGTIDIKKPFRIGRYPVTNGQYRAFIDDDGYRERRWWSDGGWAWLQEKGATEPARWHDRRWNGPNQPVVGVSFWEAEACAAWAGGRLPTEEEWEAAARGPDGHAYPWGNDWQDGICNTVEAGLGVTSPVGLFPGSRQRSFELEDMAGNVFEWCASLYDDKKEQDGLRVLRGGSWYYNRDSARCADRFWYYPDYRISYIGFRVVCSSPS